MELITFEESFNHGFDITHEKVKPSVVDYMTLLVKYLYDNNYIDDETLDDLNDYVEGTIVKRIITDLKIDIHSQIINHSSLYSKYASLYINRINRYLLALHNHCAAAKLITDGKLDEVLDISTEFDIEIANKLKEHIDQLKRESALLIKYNRYYRDDIAKLEAAIKNVTIPYDLLYTPLDGEILNPQSDYEDVYKYIQKLLLEADIINHFDKEQVTALLKKLKRIDSNNHADMSFLRGNNPLDENAPDYYKESDDYINDLAADYTVDINEIEITNYLFSSLFKSNPGVTLDDFTYNAIMKAARSVKVEDLQEILEKNDIGLTQEEIDYINKAYLNTPYKVESHTVTLLRN